MIDFADNASAFPGQLVCKRGDARCNASRVLRSRSSEGKASAYFAYGNEAEVTLCQGVQATSNTCSSNIPLSLPGDIWHHVHDIFEQNKNCYIFGFLGYGLGLVTRTNNDDAFPDYWFGTAELSIRFGPNEWWLLHGNDIELNQLTTKIEPCTCEQQKSELATTLDQSADASYIEQVTQALSWVHQKEGRRMTVARRVPLPPIDLLNSFYCQPSHNKLSQSFYLDLGNAAFVGKCPEVLLDWRQGKFESHKLSGTYPKDKNQETDSQLLRQFLTDPKILSEHQLSADGFGACIAKTGQVSRHGPNVLELNHLRHLMTTFSVETTSDTAITDCLRAVLPAGVSPCAEGLPALLAIEKIARGPYYGLVGMYQPTGHASFTQILRSVFREHNDCYSWVGAAVIHGSTAKGELEESKLKLSEIVVVLK